VHRMLSRSGFRCAKAIGCTMQITGLAVKFKIIYNQLEMNFENPQDFFV